MQYMCVCRVLYHTGEDINQTLYRGYLGWSARGERIPRVLDGAAFRLLVTTF